MALPKVEQQGEQNNYADIFNQHDADGNGQLDFQEMEEMLRSDDDKEVSHKIVKKLVQYFDKNNDGTINTKEFVNMAPDKNIKQLFGQYLDDYVDFIVPRRKRQKFRPVGHSETLEADSFSVPDGAYEESYSCWPLPIAMIIMSLFEIGCFIADEVTQPGSTKYGNGAVAKLLLFDPFKRIECWRFLTYMFVHIGCVHLIVNLIVQITIGIPLEMVNRWWRVIVVYLVGVIAGSLITSIVDPTTHLAGASGGVYAIITAHLSTIIMNWRTMSYPSIRLGIFVLIITVDVGSAIRNRYYLLEQNIGYAAHLGGALAGFLVGIWILTVVEPSEKEKYVWWAAFVSYILLMGIAIMLNIFWTDNFFNAA